MEWQQKFFIVAKQGVLETLNTQARTDLYISGKVSGVLVVLKGTARSCKQDLADSRTLGLKRVGPSADWVF